MTPTLDEPEMVFASTSPGLHVPLAAELSGLGEAVESSPAGVLLRGPAGLHQEICLRSRIANHVLLRLGDARGTTFDALTKSLRALPVDRVVRPGTEVEVAFSGKHSQVRDPSQLVRDAWGVGSGAQVKLQLRLRPDGCEVSADASGEILHKRGYRQEISRAPLRETIAAGLLRLAEYAGEEPLWDPMCGSGTIAIEGALMALRRAPGAARRFAFMDWPSFDERAWQQRLARATAEERPEAPPIIATDLNAGSVGVARRNAKRAGVLAQLKLERADARSIQPAAGSKPGLIAANLPYGIRVEADEGLYEAFGRALRRFSGWRFALLVDQGAPPEALGLAHRALAVDNGGIACSLLSGTVP